MATQTTGLLTAEMKDYYDRTLLEAAKPTLLYNRWGRRRNIPQREGDTIKWRRFEALNPATTALVEGVTPPGDDISITEVEASPVQYGKYITFSDKVVWTAIDPILTETAQWQGVQAGETLDDVTRDVLVAGTTVRYANGRVSRVTVAAGDIINGVELRKIRRTLRKNKAKTINGAYVMVVSPDTVYDLQSMSEWQLKAEASTPAQLESGNVGRMWGFDFFESEKAKVFEGAGAAGIDVHAAMAFGRDFYGVTSIEGHAMETIMKSLGSAGTEDPLNQRQSQGWKATHAAVILNQLFGVRFEHAVTA